MIHDPRETPVDVLDAMAVASEWLASLVSFDYAFVIGGRVRRVAWPHDTPIYELAQIFDVITLHGIEAAAATESAAVAAVGAVAPGSGGEQSRAEQ